MKEPYTVLILAGGQSRRMGEDKAKLEIGGETFLARLIQAFPGAAEVLISFAEEREGPEGVRTVRDDFPGAGPLAGLQKGLSAAETDLVFSVACDMPLMDEAFAEKLLAAMPEGAAAAVPRDGTGRIHPLAGWYRREAEPVARRLLEAGERRMIRFLNEIEAAYMDAAPEDAEKLMNINAPEEYQALSALFQGA